MSSSTDCLLLPSYSPSVPAPNYSFEPLSNEQVLEHTPRSVLCPLATGTFIHKNGKVTVVLDHQEDNASRPVYGRSGRITGTVCLDGYTSISGVTLIIEGRMDATSSETGALTHRIIRDSYDLWSQDTSTSDSYPTHVPFSATLPYSFRYRDSDYPLPPSFHASPSGVSSLLAEISYWLTIKVTGIRNRHIGFLTKSKSINIPFDYHPRVRSSRPIIHGPCIYSSVKAMPEEWHQSMSVLTTRSESSIRPVYSHLFVPGGRIYSLTDTIPFHVQVTGPVSSLRELMNVPQSDLNRITSADTMLSTQPPVNNGCQSPISVCLLRQVCIQTEGEKSWRNEILGEGEIRSLPPAVQCYSCLPSDQREESLDWRGELKVTSPVEAGGFNVGCIVVKDFIVLSVSPLISSSSQLLETKQTVSIRLVTDSWVDETGPEERSL